MIPKVETIVIKDYRITNKLFDDVVSKGNSKLSLTLLFYDYLMQPIKNLDTKVDVQILQKPSYAQSLSKTFKTPLLLENNLSIDPKREMQLKYRTLSRGDSE